MSKNMTKKGLALGAASALVVAGFSALPANAAGLADTSFVSLTPTTGTEYTVLADASGATFSLAANEASTVSTGNLKFLVTDPNSWVEPTIATEGRTLALPDEQPVVVDFSGDDGTDTISFTGLAAALGLETGDVIYFTDDVLGQEADDTATEKIADNDIPFTVTVAGDDAVITTNVNLGDGLTVEIDGPEVINVIREARDTTTGTFVIDSGESDPANVENITLASDSAETRSVTVQAWMDANENGKIDSTEYTSPARTIQWIKPSALVTGVSTSPVAGDDELVATVTTTPVLNGEQTNAFNGDWLNVGFTRQDDTAELYANDGAGDAGPLAAWNDTAKTFTVKVLTDADSGTAGSTNVNGNVDGGWAVLDSGINQIGSDGTDEMTKIVVAATGVVTVTTKAAHNYRVGEKLNVVINGATEDAKAASAEENGVIVTSVPSATSFTYTVSADSPTAGTADDAVADLNAGTTISVVTYGAGVSVTDRVFAGTYSAQVYVADVKSGSKLSVGTIAAATASASMSTTGSASVTGNTVTTNTANDQTIKVGTESVDLTVTAIDKDGDALGAGRTVVVSTGTPTDGGATIGSFKVNGSASATLTTDANGQVSFTVTTSDTSANAQTRVSALVENAVTVGMDLHWDAQSYSLVDYGTTAGTIGNNAAIARTITAGGSYTLELAVQDQWFQPAPAADYDVVVSGSGVSEGVRALVDGRANVTIADAGITAVGGTFTTTVVLRKDGTATSTHTVTTTIAATPSIKLGADASSTYQPNASTKVVDLSDEVAKKALVEIDKRSSTTATPAYANDLVIQGMVANSVTSADVENAYVTISGPSNILFSNGEVAARGSLTFLSDSDGEFEVVLYSTSAQKDTVITVSAMGSSATTKVTFTGQGVGEGTVLTIDTPANVAPAGTFQVRANLSDAFGNGVDTSADRMRVTYSGPGIYFGTLPTETDSNGDLTFSVLLGANDTGTITVTVSYDQNGDGDFVDTKDLTTTKTITVGESSTQKVNAGSFKGYVAVYALGYEGQRLSAKIGNDWVIVDPIVNNQSANLARVTDFTGAGVDIQVRIYIDRVLVDTIPLTTK